MSRFFKLLSLMKHLCTLANQMEDLRKVVGEESRMKGRTVLLIITDGENPFYVYVNEKGEFDLVGERRPATLVVTMSEDVLLDILKGKLTAPLAYSRGWMRVSAPVDKLPLKHVALINNYISWLQELTAGAKLS